MASTLAFRCANDPKDFSLWDPHKDTFRRLFLTEGKSLGEVKTAMEDSGFPETNVKTYEVVLREHFKFRKNLEAGQWLLVGQELDKWKSQGLDCAVSLSGITQDPRLVDKKVRRERTEAARGKLKHNKPQSFPEAVTIIPKVDSTLDIAGSTPPNIIESLESFLSLAQERKPASTTPSAPMSLSEPRLSPRQLFHDARIVGLQADFVEHILHNPISEVYERLGKNVPSRELISFLRGLWENTRLSPRERTILGEILCGFINLTRKMPPFKHEQLPDPRPFGLNDSLSILETKCASLCNHSACVSDYFLISTMETWLSTVADIRVLQLFFSIPKPAVAAMWNTLTSRYPSDRSAYAILIEAAMRAHRGKWIHRNRQELLGTAIVLGAESTAERFIDSRQVSEVRMELWALSETWVNILQSFNVEACTASVPLIVRLCSKVHAPQQLLDATLASLFWRIHSSQAAAVHWLVEEGTKIQPAILDWIPPCYYQLPSAWMPAWDLEPLSPEDLGVTSLGIKAPTTTFRNILETFLPFLGVLASARLGQDTLRRFMSYLSTSGHPERGRLLRLALTETARQHDIETTKLLLETGIFVDIEPFQRHPWKGRLTQSSDPVVASAQRFDTEILRLLLNHKLFENYHVSDILKSMSSSCYLYRRPEWQPAVDFLLERDRSILKDVWDEISPSEYPPSRELISDYVQRRVSLRRASYLEHRDLLCTIFPNDTLRETIKNGFGIDAIESLVASGIPIPSDPAGDENTLLIDALLTPSRDRYRVVHFLLRHGADPRMSSSNYTVLEATLSARGWHSPTDDDNRITLKLFRELSQLGAPFKRQTAPTTPRRPLSMLAMLIRNGANISILQQAVTAGAQINEHDTVFTTSPLITASIFGKPDTVKWLIDQGADLNARPCFESRHLHQKFTALEHAVWDGEMAMVILLLSYGAIINNSFGHVWGNGKFRRLFNAVDVAVTFGQLDILKVLVDSGGQSAHPGLSGLDGAFWEANRTNQLGIIMLLEQHTGCSWDSMHQSMKERQESGELW